MNHPRHGDYALLTCVAVAAVAAFLALAAMLSQLSCTPERPARRVRSHSPGATRVSITSIFVRPTNIGDFFQLVKLVRTSLSGVSCQGLFRRNVACGKMSVVRSLSADYASSGQALAALFGRGDVAIPLLVKQVFAGLTPCAG
ncbi:hypothetical protein ACVWW2_002290 [Bradyrhizobium sp. LM4.3]